MEKNDPLETSETLETLDTPAGLDVLGDPDPPSPGPQRVSMGDLQEILAAGDGGSSPIASLRAHLQQEAVGEALQTYKSLLQSSSDKVALQAAEKILNLAFGEDEIKGRGSSPGGGIHFHLGGSSPESTPRDVSSPPPTIGQAVSIDEEARYASG